MKNVNSKSIPLQTKMKSVETLAILKAIMSPCPWTIFGTIFFIGYIYDTSKDTFS